MDSSMTHTNTNSPKPFRVIIVGAGIVGLSLSHALQLAHIDHVVLEKYDKVKSVKGAALIIWPNVERIFDQFDILSTILETLTPVATEYQRWPDGSIQDNRSTMDRLHKMCVTLPGSQHPVFTLHWEPLTKTGSKYHLYCSIASLAWPTCSTICQISHQSSRTNV